MSLLKKIFKPASEATTPTSNYLEWIPMNAETDVADLNQISATEKVYIFKHSTRCGISRMVYKLFEKKVEAAQVPLKVYYLDLLSFRALSNEIAAHYQVQHQSPQLIVVAHGRVVDHASHYDITSVALPTPI